jgi:hypothetical protein
MGNVMKHNIDEILYKCKEEIRNGSSVKDCVVKYGSQIPDLEFALQSLYALSSVSVPVPDEKRKLKSRERLLLEFEQKELDLTLKNTLVSNVRNYSGGFEWRNYPFVVRIMVGMVLIFVICGLTFAIAGNSLPGSPFYPVKRMAEAARIEMAQNDTDKGMLYIDVTQARIYEYEALQTDSLSRKALKEDIRKDLRITETLALKSARVRAALEKMRNKNKEILLSVLDVTSSYGKDDAKKSPANYQSIIEPSGKQETNPGNAKGLIKKNAVTSTSTSTTLKWKTNQNFGEQNKFRWASSNSTSLRTSTCSTNFAKTGTYGNAGSAGNGYRKGPPAGQNEAKYNTTTTIQSNPSNLIGTTTGPNLTNSNETQTHNEGNNGAQISLGNGNEVQVDNGSNNSSQTIESVDTQGAGGSAIGGSLNQEQKQSGNGFGYGQNAGGADRGGSGSTDDQISGSGYRYRGGNN